MVHNAPSEEVLKNIQGDIIKGVPKKSEDFVFAEITDVPAFRKYLPELLKHVTTGWDLECMRREIFEAKRASAASGTAAPLLDCYGLTLGFSATGVQKMNKDPSEIHRPNASESQFVDGMQKDAAALGDTVKDDGSPDWDANFLKNIDVVFKIAGDCRSHVEERWATVQEILRGGTAASSVRIVNHVKGDVRSPPGQEHNEHFGYSDGISQPFVNGLSGGEPLRGQPICGPEIILMGYDAGTPGWIKDSSFMSFRKLAQRVPEWDDFLRKNANPLNGFPEGQKGADLLGARFVGRWKSGCPVALRPLEDDPVLGADKTKNNDYLYDRDSNQAACPFASHARRTYPRNDIGLEESAEFLMLRRGITYGDEVTNAERENNTTTKDRGLLFACYTSSIVRGFRFVQQSWCNNTQFPFLPAPAEPGFDPLVGHNGNNPRPMTGWSLQNAANSLPLPIFIEPKGGEYFFVPSIDCLKNEFAVAA